ncbi:ThiF family adenylyltransferase [Candidatus Woesearchaeota archaeon]|nr:ThiF family adenylyltransferase [Candidatus Woesearchaeota archaeon]
MRYIKQEIFSKIGKENQLKLYKSTVSVVGIGALGTILLDILARSGIGKIKIIDRDIIELSNLQRQTLFTEEDLGKPKVVVGKEKISQINSEIDIEAHLIDLDHDNINIIKSDLILDCTDNIYTRFLINEYSRKNNIPWIYTSVIGSKGMTMNVTKENPCFACIFKEPRQALETCDTYGVLNTTPHALAAIQATEAIKILTGQDYNKDLIYYDLWKNEINKIKIRKSKDCRVCNGIYSYLEGKKLKGTIKICGSCNYQIKIDNINMEDLFNKLNKLNSIKTTDDCLILNDIIFFKTGRALVRAKTKEKAKAIIDRYLG